MSAINYSKWDNLELSDDSDIECHPNVDKRSFIRWKQQDIHRKREEQRIRIEQLEGQVNMQNNMLSQLQELITEVEKPNGIDGFVAHVERMRQQAKDNGSSDTKIPAHPTAVDDHEMVRFDTVMGSLLGQIQDALKTQRPDQVQRSLLLRLKDQQKTVTKKLEEVSKELEKEQKAKSKKITSDVLKDGFNKTVVAKNQEEDKPPTKPKKKEKVYETLNPNTQMKDLSLASEQANFSNGAAEDEEDEDDIEKLKLTPEAREFAKIEGFEASFKYITQHPQIVNQDISDSIMAEAFSSQLTKKEKYAKNCVVQALMIQYAVQLGKDGISLFFHRMMGQDNRPRNLFMEDVAKTYKHIQDRCVILAKERAEREEDEEESSEAVQLQAMSPGAQLTIRIPTEAHPEAWTVFTSFPEDLQEALKSGQLDSINQALASMNTEDAEEVIRKCDEAGILSVVQAPLAEEGSQQNSQEENSVPMEEVLE